MIKPEMLV